MMTVLSLLPVVPVSGSRILYREQLYRMYRLHLYQYPELYAENIYYLEEALRSDFANPLYALAVIETPEEWERYRYLFTMHINLKILDQYLLWGSKYNKFEAYFYNYPWRDQNLESLEKAERLFRYALVYWEEARRWSEEAWRLRTVHLPNIQHWADENYRIETGDLDYGFIISRHLERLEAVREAFQAMDPGTY
jgi:hypothetical protein